MKKTDSSAASVVTKADVDRAALKARVLGEETTRVLDSVASKNYNAIRWFVVSWSVLFGLAVFGLFQQNHIAQENKNHIDCIIKDLATPRPTDKSQKYIDYQSILSKDCKIKFTV